MNYVSFLDDNSTSFIGYESLELTIVVDGRLDEWTIEVSLNKADF